MFGSRQPLCAGNEPCRSWTSGYVACLLCGAKLCSPAHLLPYRCHQLHGAELACQTWWNCPTRWHHCGFTQWCECVPIQPVHRLLLVGKSRQLEPSHSSGQSYIISWAAALAQRDRLQSWRRDYQESSAVPMTSNKASQLVDFIDSQAAASSNTMEVLLYQRDALIALLMWESCLRGVDCGKLRLLDLFLPSGSSAQLPLPEPLSAGSQLVTRPNGSKTVKGRRAGAISLVHTGSDVHCSLPRLMRYLRARAAAGMPVGQFLFNASTRCHNSFVDAAFCSSSIGKRLHLVDASLFNGESNHGYRRGRMQEYSGSYSGNGQCCYWQSRPDQKYCHS